MSRIVLPPKDLTKPVKQIKVKKRKPRRTLGQKTAAQLVKEADKYWSRYVRLRDSEFNGVSFVGTCITCTKTDTIAWFDEDGNLRYSKGWDAGHFVSRGNKVVRFDEMNVNLQCAMRCNKMRSGEMVKYRAALKLKYGDGIPSILENLAENTKHYKFPKPELLQIIQDAKTQIAYYADHR